MPKKEKVSEEKLVAEKLAEKKLVEKKAVGFWPFDDYKDGVRRHWEWLRRWLLAHVRTSVALLIMACTVVTLWAATDRWLPLLQELPQKYTMPANTLQTGKINPIKVELTPTPTEVITRRFETTVREDVFGHPDTVTAKASQQATGKANDQANHLATNGDDSDKFSKPMEGKLAVPYGLAYSPVYQDYRFHDGIDIVSTQDDRVKAVLDGTVADISKDDAEGLVIIIDHQKAYRSVYGHIRNPEVTVGQKVKKGQNIGKVEAEKGILHFAIQKGQQGLNPLQYLSY